MMRYLGPCIVGGLFVLTGFGGCSTRERPASAKRISRQAVPSSEVRDSLISVQFMFAADSQDAAFLDSALIHVRELYYRPNDRLVAEIYRFGPDKQRRYLLVVPMQTAAGKRGIRLVVVEQGKAVSGPSPVLAPDEIDRFAIDSIADFDRNGSLDVSYCVWPGRRGTRGQLQALTYRDGSWRQLSPAVVGRRTCEAQGEP